MQDTRSDHRDMIPGVKIRTSVGKSLMSNTSSPLGRIAGSVLAGTAVALGAWAAHGLDGVLDNVYGEETREHLGRTISATEKYVGDFRTGVTYQMWTALALLATASWTGRAAAIGRGCVLVGAIVFSGSLYILALSGVRLWGAVTPIGGMLMLIGWLSFCVAGFARPGDASKTTHAPEADH